MSTRPPISGDRAPSGPRAVVAPARRDRARIRAMIVLLALVMVSALSVWLILRADARQTARATPTTPASCVHGSTGTALTGAQIRIRVLNATGRQGLAGTVAAQLTLRGYTVTSVGNHSGRVKVPAEMRYGVAGAPAAKALAGLVKGAVSRPLSRPGPEVDLVLGDTFTGLAPGAPKPLPVPAGCPATATSAR
ncbi:MAG: LytR C-terminal domain-containing protein [Pseudonocardiales bacterium]